MAEQRTLADIVRDWNLRSEGVGLNYRAMLAPPAVVQAAMATEMARARLIAVTGRALGAVEAEVERRRHVGMSERAAIESVYDDVINARWVTAQPMRQARATTEETR